MSGDAASAAYRCGDYAILAGSRRVLRDGEPVELEAKVFDLILLLLENRQRALDKQEIVTALWGKRPVTDAALSQLVYKARRVFNDDGEHQAVIRTVYGRGLQWIAPVDGLNDEAQSLAAPRPPETTAAPAPLPSPRRHSRMLWAGACAVLAAIVLGFAIVHHDRASATPQPPRVAVLPLQNDTGEATLAWTVNGVPGLIGSLLESHDDMLAVNQRTIAKAWKFTVPKGQSRAEHVRFVTGAGILVSPTLRKLGAKLYELDLRIDSANAKRPSKLVLDGADPAKLAVQAVPRIRTVVGLGPVNQPTLSGPPKDIYLAETFARGMDAGSHGRWTDAKPYFTLCAKEDPDFLPCRLRLGEAEAHTDQAKQAGQTEQALLSDASKRHDTRMAAQTLSMLAAQALIQDRFSEALRDLDRATPLVKQSRDVALQVQIALNAAAAAANLKQMDRATSELAHARNLIADHHLRNKEGDLHNTESFVAFARGDYAAAEKADRAAIDAAITLGDQTDAMVNLYNLGSSTLQAGRPMEALPLLVAARQRGQELGNKQVWFYSINDLTNILLDAGLEQRARPLIEQMLKTSAQQGIAIWHGWALGARSSYETLENHYAKALLDSRKAVTLIDAKEDPGDWLGQQLETAQLALSIDPTSLTALAQQVDATIAAQPRPEQYAYRRYLTRALAAAARHDADGAHTALQQAAALPHPDDPGGNDLRRASFTIAVANHDAEAARIALQGFDAERCKAAGVLRLAEQWARQNHDRASVKRFGQRQAALQKTALAALRQAGMGTQP